MNGKEAIIEKILSDAREKAKEITDHVAYDDAMSETATQDWIKKYLEKERAVLKKDCSDLIERRVTLAELDKRKLLLQTKQTAIDDVISSAHKKLCALKKADYLNFVLSLIEKYAEDGDQIVLSSDKVLCASDLTGASVVKSKNLTVAEKPGAFLGGVLLVGKISDKDLTFASVLEEERERLTEKITAELFD